MDCCNRKPEQSTKVRELVKDRYGAIAKGSLSCCGDQTRPVAEIGEKLGYTTDELDKIPDGANLGLGCGNPTAIDTLKPGEVVLDLGSGAGMDVFLAASQVGSGGKVIGVDMTEEMVEKARENAKKSETTNVEFRLGNIESLPVEDNSVDAVISNCVINLSPEKEKVFKEAFRVLKPGGRLMVSDIVLEQPLPEVVAESVTAYAGCVAGAELKENYIKLITDSGFEDISATPKGTFADMAVESDPLVAEVISELDIGFNQVKDILSTVKSLKIFARKGENLPG